MKTILYSVSNGYFARNLLRTGVIEKLLEHNDIRIVIVSPGYDDANFIKDFSFSDRIFIEKMLEVNKHNINKSYDVIDKLIWKLWLLGHNYKYFQGLYKFFLKLQVIRSYYRKFKNYYGELFDKYTPNLVVGATPGVNIKSVGDLPVFAMAQKRGIKTLALIHSWDNIAKRKGPMWIRPDILGVWNEFQKQEAIKVNFYKEGDIKLVGPAHFDIYWRQDTFIGREAFFKKMGLDPNKKLVTIISTAEGLVDNNYIVDILLDAFKKNRYVLPIQLLFRLSHVPPECNDQMYGRFYNNPNITIDYPGEHSLKLGWNPSQQQMHHFANLVKYSDVQVSIVSTATVEAAILDRPVVNIGFSTVQPELFQKLIIESVFKCHFKPIIDFGATYIAKNPDDLIAGINSYLLNPALHRQERARLKEALIYKADGKAAERIAHTILELLR